MSAKHSKLIHYQSIQNLQAAGKNPEENLPFLQSSKAKLQCVYVLKLCSSTASCH
jgi:hypothetical protein